jgi:hypothetical protein
VVTGIWCLLAGVVAFGIPAQKPPETDDVGAIGGAVPPPLPGDGYYLPQYADWIGQPFRNLEITSWIVDLPENIEFGRQYVIFYRKDCEHCHELMELFFFESVPAPTTAVAVPERDGFPTENLQPFACPACVLAELPAGIDWFLQTPVLVRLGDGVVECAAEVEASAPECLEW